MPRLIKIEENLKINYAKEIKEYLNPDNVYIPYEKKYNVDIKSNEYVLLNSLVLHNDDDYVYSPISGTIIGASESIVDGKKAPTIVIENDFKEKTYKVKGVLKNITNYKPNEFKNIIKIYNAYYGSLEGETLVISGIDYEPYEETMSFLIKSHTNEFLECIDAISHILQIHKCFFAIKNNDSDNVKTLVDQIGTYPNINLKLMPDLYPIGQKDILINELVTEKKKDKGVIFLTVEDVFAIYNVLKKKKPITEKLITISGDLIDKPTVMLVKIGTNIGDIIANFFKVKDENFKIVINGLLSGYTIPSLNAVVTPLTRSIFITSEQQEKARKCINCGLCVLHCPVKANPKEKLRMDKCIKCGLCNYICPSKIKLMGGKKMKDVFIKSKMNLKKINIYLFISLLPLIIAGFYKNGINLYINHLVSFLGMLKPLIFDILGLTIGISVNIIHERIFRKSKDKLSSIMFTSFHPFYGLLIASVISINTNIFLFIMITFLSLMISKFFKSSNINIVALTSLLIIFCINLTGDFSFLNKLESNNDLNLIALDYLLGKGSGGINATNVIVLIISLLILCNQLFYKKNIPLYSTITYVSCMLIYCIITGNIGSILDNIFANNVLFSFVFIATEPLSSPYTYKGQIIYSVIIGILTFGMYLIYPPLAALGGIIIASICHKTIDKFFA